jgi:hypothetical protein
MQNIKKRSGKNYIDIYRKEDRKLVITLLLMNIVIKK